MAKEAENGIWGIGLYGQNLGRAVFLAGKDCHVPVWGCPNLGYGCRGNPAAIPESQGPLYTGRPNLKLLLEKGNRQHILNLPGRIPQKRQTLFGNRSAPAVVEQRGRTTKGLFLSAYPPLAGTAYVQENRILIVCAQSHAALTGSDLSERRVQRGRRLLHTFPGPLLQRP